MPNALSLLTRADHLAYAVEYQRLSAEYSRKARIFNDPSWQLYGTHGAFWQREAKHAAEKARFHLFAALDMRG